MDRVEIGQVKRVKWGFNDHVVKTKPTESRSRSWVLGKRGGLDVSGESWVEVLDYSEFPIGGGIGGEAEDLGGAFVLVADAKWAFRLVRVRVRVRFGFEIGRTPSSGGREDDPSVIYSVFPDFCAPIF